MKKILSFLVLTGLMIQPIMAQEQAAPTAQASPEVWRGWLKSSLESSKSKEEKRGIIEKTKAYLRSKGACLKRGENCSKKEQWGLRALAAAVALAVAALAVIAGKKVAGTIQEKREEKKRQEAEQERLRQQQQEEERKKNREEQLKKQKEGQKKYEKEKKEWWALITKGDLLFSERKRRTALLQSHPEFAKLQDENGKTPLMHFLGGGWVLPPRLFEKDAIDIQDNQGKTALIHAIEKIAKGATVGKQTLESLLENADPNILDKKGNTALIYAVKGSNVNPDVVKQLLEKGANPNILDKQGNTALIHAVKGPNVNLAVVEELLKKGADPNIQDRKGNNALMYAVSHRRSGDILEKLFTWAPNIKLNLKNNKGKTAYIEAVENGQLVSAAFIAGKEGFNIETVDNQGDSQLVQLLKIIQFNPSKMSALEDLLVRKFYNQPVQDQKALDLAKEMDNKQKIFYDLDENYRAKLGLKRLGTWKTFKHIMSK